MPTESELEAALRERTAELAQCRRRLDEASTAKARFVADMGHDLRTPLNTIIGFSTILMQEMAGPVNDEQRKQLEMILQAGRRQLELINELIELSKAEKADP